MDDFQTGNIHELPAHPEQNNTTQSFLRNGFALPKMRADLEVYRNSITGKALDFPNRAFTHNVTFTTPDSDSVSWGSGTLISSNGEQVSIDAGATNNLAVTSFIYFNGSSSLQLASNMSDAVGDGRLLLAIAVPSAITGAGVELTLFGARGGTIRADAIKGGIGYFPDGGTAFDLDHNRIAAWENGFLTGVFGKMPNGGHGLFINQGKIEVRNSDLEIVIDELGVNSLSMFFTNSVTDANSQSTASTSFVDVTNMTISFDMERPGLIMLCATVTGNNSTAGQTAEVAIMVDGVQQGASILLSQGASSSSITGSTTAIVQLDTGSHVVKLQFKASANTAQISATKKYLSYTRLGR